MMCRTRNHWRRPPRTRCEPTQDRDWYRCVRQTCAHCERYSRASSSTLHYLIRAHATHAITRFASPCLPPDLLDRSLENTQCRAVRSLVSWDADLRADYGARFPPQPHWICTPQWRTTLSPIRRELLCSAKYRKRHGPFVQRLVRWWEWLPY